MADGGTYTCVITDSAGTAITTSAPISFTTQPVGANKYVGDNYTLSVAVSGGSGTGFSFTYQWTQNGANVSGATNATLALTNLQTANAGSYVCLVGETPGVRPPAAMVLSNAATLNVQPPLSFTTQPVGGAKAVGNSFAFSVAVSGGYPSLSYRLP